MHGLIVSRNVHYVAYNGTCLAAFIIGVGDRENGVCDLALFTNLTNAAKTTNFGQQFHAAIPFSERAKPGTWHWAEHE
jgi:hypothetical protein